MRQTLNNFEASRKGSPNVPHHNITHYISADPGKSQPYLTWLKRGLIEGLGDIPRFRELQLKMSPAMHFTTKFPPPNLRFNFSGLVEAGNLVTIGGDWTSGMILPLFLSVACLVEDIGADRAIEMLTISGAGAVARDMVSTDSTCLL